MVISVKIPVLGYTELAKVVKNPCTSVAISSVQTTKPLLTKFTPNMYYGSAYGRDKLL